MNRAAIFAALICSALGAGEAGALSPFTVFFDPGSSVLDAQARAILDNAGKSWRVNQADLLISGYADRKGTVASNRRLSCARADAVRSYLVRQGVPAHRTLMEGWGELSLAVETPDGAEDAHNRRVVVIFQAPGTHRAVQPHSYLC